MNRLFLISKESSFRQVTILDEVHDVPNTAGEGHLLIRSPQETARSIIGQAYAAIQYVNAACSALLNTKFDPHPKPGVDPIWYRNIEGLFYSAHACANLWKGKLSDEMLYLVPIIVLIYKRVFDDGENQILRVLEPYEMSARISQRDYQLILRELDKMYRKILINQNDHAAVVPKLLQWFGEDGNHGMRDISRQLHLLVDERYPLEENDFAQAGILDAVATVKAGAVFSCAPQALPLNVSRYCEAIQRLKKMLDDGTSIATTVRILDIIIESIVCNVDAAVSKMTDVQTVWSAFGKQMQSVVSALKEAAGLDQTVFEYTAEILEIQMEWASLALYAENLLESRNKSIG